VTRRVLAIQQYDVDICQHETDNVLADILSWKPSVLSETETSDLRRPDTILLHAMNLKIDNNVCKDLEIVASYRTLTPT
jgi:hypothetical protein